MFCTHCGKENPDQARYCGACGRHSVQAAGPSDISFAVRSECEEPSSPLGSSQHRASKRPRFYPNHIQWRVIWVSVGLIAIAGLFPLGLENLTQPSLTEQNQVIAGKDLQRRDECAAARAAQGRQIAEARREAQAEAEREEQKADTYFRDGKVYFPRSPVRVPRPRLPAACAAVFGDVAEPLRENAQRELVRYLFLVTGVICGLLVWQFSGLGRTEP
jgi:hypothetical protein